MVTRILEMLDQDENEKLVRVGRISAELQKEINENARKHREEHEELKAKIEAYIEKITADHSCEKFNDEKAELWERVYDELGLTEEERGKHYTIKNGLRVVYRVESEDEDDFENEILN